MQINRKQISPSAIKRRSGEKHKRTFSHYAVVWPDVEKVCPLPRGSVHKDNHVTNDVIKNWVKFVLTELDSLLVRWLNAAITIISLESDSLSLASQKIESINVKLTRLLHIYVCAAQKCACCQCMPQQWLWSVWSLSHIQNAKGEVNHFAQRDGEKESETDWRSGQRETWDNWNELPLKFLAAEFMSSTCGAYLQHVLSSWPYIASGTIRQPWYKYWVETFWQLKLWPKC